MFRRLRGGYKEPKKKQTINLVQRRKIHPFPQRKELQGWVIWGQACIYNDFMKLNYKEMRTFIIIGVILFLMFLFSNFQDFLILIG